MAPTVSARNNTNNDPSDKITICHAANSQTNPYTTNTISRSSVDNTGNQYLNGHGDHTGPVWYSGIADHSWGDIIPSFTSDLGTIFPGQNWDETGQAIWNNKCKVPAKTDTTKLTIVKDAQGDPTQAFDFTLTQDNSNSSNDFSLKNGESKSYDLKSDKSYTVTEATTDGWDLTNIVCNDEDDITVDLANHKVTVELDDEEDITCTFTNVQQEEPKAPATLTIKKILQSDSGSSQDFTFTSDELGGFQLDADESSNTLPSSRIFNGLDAGEYGVREQSIWGWEVEEITCDGTSDYTANGHEGRLQVNLQPGDNVTCTFVNEQMNALGGFKFNDLNGNGKWDANEPTIEGWTMTITGGEDNITESIQTNSDGFYTFTGLENGIYKVCEEQRAGWVQTFPATNDGCYTITDFNEHNGLEKNGFDFGNMQPVVVRTGTINGSKFNDINGNHVWDENEPALAGWTIKLTKECSNDDQVVYLLNIQSENNEDGCVPVEQTTVTGANGAYSFADLAPGDYTVCEVQQDKWTQTFPQDNNGCHKISIEGSGEVITANFGNKAKPQVLDEATTQQLVNTGASTGKGMVFGLVLLGTLGTLHFLTGRRKSYQN
jgi:hypothetical protein